MDVDLPADKEARLRDFATRAGREPAKLVEEAVDRMLEYEFGFPESVEQGRAAARRGALLEHDEVVERIDRILRR